MVYSTMGVAMVGVSICILSWLGFRTEHPEDTKHQVYKELGLVYPISYPLYNTMFFSVLGLVSESPLFSIPPEHVGRITARLRFIRLM